jgi:hypothetical protein
MRGGIKGEWVDGEARTIDTEFSEHVFSLLKKKYGTLYRIMRFAERFSRVKLSRSVWRFELVLDAFVPVR